MVVLEQKVEIVISLQVSLPKYSFKTSKQSTGCFKAARRLQSQTGLQNIIQLVWCAGNREVTEFPQWIAPHTPGAVGEVVLIFFIRSTFY